MPVASANGEEFHHHKNPIPEAILHLLKPIYSRLGSFSLLEKCLHGYTQNANESLHSVVWKFCPKELFLGKISVDTACAMAVCSFNDGATSLSTIARSTGTGAISVLRAPLEEEGCTENTREQVQVKSESQETQKSIHEEEEGAG